MVGHAYVGKQQYFVHVERVRQLLKKYTIILFLPVYILSLVPPAGYVIVCTWILDSQLPCHGNSLSMSYSYVNMSSRPVSPMKTGFNRQAFLYDALPHAATTCKYVSTLSSPLSPAPLRTVLALFTHTAPHMVNSQKIRTY